MLEPYNSALSLHAGDSRAVLSRNGLAVRMSTDHSPDVPAERQRIETKGGCVRIVHGVGRIALPCKISNRIKLLSVSRWVIGLERA